MRAGGAGRLQQGRRAAALVLVPGSDARCSKAIAQKDPDCAMAHWGIALSQWGNPFGGLQQAQVDRDAARRSIDEGAGDRLADAARARATSTPSPACFTSADPGDAARRASSRYEAAMAKIVARQSRTTSKCRIFYALAVDPDGAADRQDLREAAAGGRHSRAALQEDADASRAGALHHSRLRRAAAGRARRSSPRAATRRSRRRCRTRCTCRRTPSRASARGRNRSRPTAGRPRPRARTQRRRRGAARARLSDLRVPADRAGQGGQGRRSITRSASSAAPKAMAAGAAGAGAFAIAAIPARYALERGAWAEAAALPARPGEHAVHRSDHALRARHRRRAQRQSRGGRAPTSSGSPRCATS